MNDTTLTLLLRATAVGHFCIAILSTQLPRLLHWQDDIARMSLLVREVFKIHSFFITFIMVMFGTLTWKFAPVFAAGGNEVAVWLAAGLALFWGIRTVFQWTFYSRSHWQGKPRETAAHWTFTFVYGIWTILYAACALR